MKEIPLFVVNMPSRVGKPLLETLFSGQVTQGPRVAEFEKALGLFLHNPLTLAVNSGTSALTLALRLANVDEYSEVITTPMTCTATNMPILSLGATPVWADVDPVSGLIDPADVARKITYKTRAIMAVHWGGAPCDMDALRWLADKEDVALIEDAAHAFGATYKGRQVGQDTADFSCFSFQAIKHLTTVDGGALTCRGDLSYSRGKLLRWYGIDRDAKRTDFRIEEDVQEWGYKFHMNDVTAALGLAQMESIDAVLGRHRENAKYYRENLEMTPASTDVGSASWLYTVLCEDAHERKEFMAFMKAHAVQVSQVHARNDSMTCFAPYRVELPGVDSFSKRMVSIPVHSRLQHDERDRIVEAGNEFVRRHR